MYQEPWAELPFRSQVLVLHTSAYGLWTNSLGMTWEGAKQTRICLCVLCCCKRLLCSWSLRNRPPCPAVWITCGAFKTSPDRLLSQAEKVTLSKDRATELFVKKTFKMILGAAGTENLCSREPLCFQGVDFPLC